MKNDNQNGWVLIPTILLGLAITIILAILFSFIASASTSIYGRAYRSMAQQAALSGVNYASSCFGVSSSRTALLTPNTNCSGQIIDDASLYIDDTPQYRSTFSASAPDQQNGLSTITVTGRVELLFNGIPVKTYEYISKTATGGVAYTRQVGVGGLSVCVIGANSALYCGGITNMSEDSVEFTVSLQLVPGISNVTSISTSKLYNNCAIANGGKLYCWGLNDNGQLGTGDTTPSPTPIEVSGIGAVTSVAASSTHTCAIVAGGELYCWGSNSLGQLGIGNTDEQHTPHHVSTISNVVNVSVSIDNTCATTADGKLYCWGSNYAGQLGTGAPTGNWAYQATPQHVTTLNDNVTNVSTGGMGLSQIYNSTCATTAGGELYCWGGNAKGQLGIGNNTNQSIPQLVSLPSSVTQVVAGTHTCAITVDSNLYCWGQNTHGTIDTGGMLGIGSAPDQNTPQHVDSLQDVVTVASSYDTTCAATANGSAYCWGANVFNLPDWFETIPIEDAIGYVLGEKTDPSYTIAYDTPQPVGQAQVDGGISEITSGDGHTCITTADSNAYCWGDNIKYQLGTTTPSEAFPNAQKVLNINNITSMSAGGDTSCATTTEGNLYCWGDDQYDIFKIGDPGDPSAKQQVTALSDVTQVTTSLTHACAITVVGDLYCWGDTASGQLGIGNHYTDVGSVPPNQVTDLSNVVSVSAGYNHTCAITANGNLYCWGDNTYGQLGTGDNTNQSTPTLVTEISNVVSVSTGNSTTCATTAGNDAYCWGDNSHGQLGNGDTTSQNTPYLLGSGIVLSVSTSGDHTCAIITAVVSIDNNSLVCWGNNEYGQLGTGSAGGYESEPSLLSGISNVTAVTTGVDYTCATTTGSKVYCWGANLSGQLGVGYYSEIEPSPQLVPGPWKPSLPRIIY